MISDVLTSLLKALRQLGDPAVLRVLAKTIVVTLVIFAAGGAALYWALVYAFAAAGWETGGFAEAAAAVVIAVAAFWLWFRVVALAVLQFFADEIVAAVETRHYPEAAARAAKLPFKRDLANSLRGAGRAVGANLLALPLVIALSVTGIGSAAVLIAVNGWLLGRELTDMAWFRHCGDYPEANPVKGSMRMLLGAAIAGMMLIPLAGLIAPVIGAAAGTHLVHRAISRAGPPSKGAL